MSAVMAQCEGVSNSLPSAIKRALSREELPRHCRRRTCGEGYFSINLILEMSGRHD